VAKYILFDTETTGNQQEDRVIQIGAIIMGNDGSVEIFDELCSVDIDIKFEAMAVHHITPQMISNKPSFIESKFYKILQSLNTDDNYLIAHNLPFDLGMIKKEGFEPNLKLIDTLRVAKHLLKEQNSKALQYLRYALGLYLQEDKEAKKYNITIKAHSGIGDVLVMKLLVSYLVKIIKDQNPTQNPMDKMVELTTTPIIIEKFTFGKYKGKTLNEVYQNDKNYINWLINNTDDEDLKYSLNYLENA
jgi:DNA polymerase III epsilon subunit-like protein